MAIRPGHIFTAFIGGVGAIFLTLGLVFLISEAPEEEVKRVAALTVFDTQTWKKAAAGTTVLVEGRIAAGTPPVFRDFVACRREKYAGTKQVRPKTPPVEQWSLIGVFTPSLRLEGPGPGSDASPSVALVNSGYELESPLHSWRDPDVRTEFFKDLGERAAGFIVGDLVTAEGRVVEGGLEAVRLIGGDAATYRETTRRQAMTTGVLGLVFTPLGSVLVALAAFIGWRIRRPKSRSQSPKA